MAWFARTKTENLPPDKWKVALDAALKVSEIAASATPLPVAVQSMVKAATELVRADQGSIMLLDDSGRTLVLAAASGLPAEAAGFRLPVGESVAGRVLASGRPMRLGDVNQEAFVNFVPKDRSISSSVVVPLRVQGRSIGVLNLAMSDPSIQFTDDDVRLAQLFADQAAALIYRANLHERAEQRSSDLMALIESSRGLVGTLQLDRLLELVLDGGARLVGAKGGFACLLDPDSGAISRGVFRGIDKAAIGELMSSSQIRTAIDRSELVAVQHSNLGSFVALGLRSNRGTRGALVVMADPQVITDRADLLRAFGQQCATGIGASELYSEVERKESELSSIIHGAPSPIVLADAARRIVAINPAAEDVFGITATFSTGASVENTFTDSQIVEFLMGGGDFEAEVEVGNPGRTFKVRVADVHVPGRPQGRVLVMDDITAEREIVQMQRDFVAMIGHELRTPLTIIKGFARTLLRRVEQASIDETRDAVATIDSKAARLEHLIEDLLYVSKIETREAALRVEQVDFNTLLNDVVEDVVRQYKGREVLMDVPPSLLCPCDIAKTELIVRHLVDNALKFSEAAVTIRVTEDDDEITVDVIDEGDGILSSDIPHIFERFRQLDGSSTREHGGTGVGLYLAAQLVRMHRGRIWVESTWGKGSTFSFSLPRRAPRSDLIRVREQDVNDEILHATRDIL